MKVADIMQTNIITTTVDAPLKEIGRYIFSLGISGIPVVDGTKLIGIVTEKDILSRLYPTLEELAEDYIHIRDFEEMEKRLGEMLDVNVSDVMSRKITTVSPSTPILHAQSMMMVNDISHLPVVDTEQNLVGIISQGDIFRRLIKDEIPKLEQEKYADFIATHFDQMIDWEKREKYEYPSLMKILDRENVKSLIEFGVWTGEFTVGLAKLGKYKILGLDHNETMIDLCNEKKEKLPEKLKSSLDFLLTDYKDFQNVEQKYDAAICVGNGLAYAPVTPEELFPKLAKILKDKSMIFLQILNMEKILKMRGRLLSFGINEDKGTQKEELFVEFFEKKGEKGLFQNLIHFDNDGKNWLYKGITSIQVNLLNKKVLESALKKAGFSDISFYGGMGKYKGDKYEMSFEEVFSEKESDWLNVIAKR